MLTATNKLVLKYVPIAREVLNDKNPSKNTNNGYRITSSSPRIDNNDETINLNNRKESENDKQRKSQAFYLAVKQIFIYLLNSVLNDIDQIILKLHNIFDNEPSKRKYILDELRIFNETKNIYKLVENLNATLTTPSQRLLLDEIKIFIPPHQQDLYHNLVKSKIYESINDLPKSMPFIAELAEDKKSNIPLHVSESLVPKGIRRLVLLREKNEKFGLTLHGSQPVIINSVDLNSPADLSGLRSNDVILSINDMDVSDKNHKFLVELLKSSGLNPIFEVALNYVIYLKKYEIYNSSHFSKVIQKSEFDATRYSLEHLKVIKSLDVLDLKNSEGKTFKEKVKIKIMSLNHD